MIWIGCGLGFDCFELGWCWFSWFFGVLGLLDLFGGGFLLFACYGFMAALIYV